MQGCPDLGENGLLENSRIIAFIATAVPDASKRFYNEILGLTLAEETPFAIVFETNNTVIRIQKTERVYPPPYTSLGWEVDSIAETVQTLSAMGVQFERYEGLEQDGLGVWNVPDGAKVAWFKDPDSNLLSLTQVA